ncbi:MAG: KEOPS complex kinase/ATPase Bud32 [Nanoarchaeota archaeon]
MGKVIAQGAEAIISLKKNIILKDRIKKSYRLPELDEKLRRIRTKKEVKLLEKASFLIPVPKVIKHNSSQIELEYIKGKKLAQYLNTSKNKSKIAKLIGENLAKLHDRNIIHGDLTTSNMILKEVECKGTLVPYLYFIDFGLGFESKRAEDKATDLHVLKEALEAKHYKHANQVWKSILKAYKKTSSNSKTVLKQLDKVESRGRYKAQY